MSDATSLRRSGSSIAAILLAAAFVAFSLPALAQDKPAPADQTFSIWPKWGPFLDVEGKVGTKRSLGELDLFVPLVQDERTMLFGNARFRVDDQSSYEGNFGLGVRRMLEGGWNIGTYGYYDRRRSPNANFFNQLTFGAELLGTNFDLRANSYWPIGTTQQQVGPATTGPSTATVLVGGALQVFTPATMGNIEYAMRGFDAEAGVRIPITPAESPYHLRFYAGGFYFDTPSGVTPVVSGPRLRLEFTDYAVPGLWGGTRFSVGGEWQTDEVRGSQFFAGLRLRVPLQGEPRRASFTMQERRMTDPIVRDVDIVSQVQTVQLAPSITDSATQTASGQTITGITSATTTGAALPGAITAAGVNSTVVLQGTFNTTATTSMPFGQTLIGGGPIALRTASGRTVTANLPGATIAGTNVPLAALQLNAGATVIGLNVSNAYSGGSGGSAAIMAGGAGNLTILNNTFTVTQSGANGALALSSGGVNTNTLISGNTLIATGSGPATAMTALGLSGGGAASTYTVVGNTMSASGGNTFSRIANVSGVTINAGSTDNVRGSGVCFGAPTSGSILFTNGTTCP